MSGAIESKKKPSFFKTPLVFVFMIFGSTIGGYLGTGMITAAPGQAGIFIFVVSVFSIGVAFWGGSIGYVISSGIDSIVEKKTARVIIKWIAGIVALACF